MYASRRRESGYCRGQTKKSRPRKGRESLALPPSFRRRFPVDGMPRHLSAAYDTERPTAGMLPHAALNLLRVPCNGGLPGRLTEVRPSFSEMISGSFLNVGFAASGRLSGDQASSVLVLFTECNRRIEFTSIYTPPAAECQSGGGPADPSSASAAHDAMGPLPNVKGTRDKGVARGGHGSGG